MKFQKCWKIAIFAEISLKSYENLLFLIPAKMLTIFCWNFEIWAVRRIENLVDLEKCWKMSIWSQRSALIQRRTSPLKFDDLAEKSEKSSVSNFSTKAQAVLHARKLRPEPRDGRVGLRRSRLDQVGLGRMRYVHFYGEVPTLERSFFRETRDCPSSGWMDGSQTRRVLTPVATIKY